MHAASQTFILNLTPQVNPFLIFICLFKFNVLPLLCFFKKPVVVVCCLLFSNINICFQMNICRQRVDEFIMPSLNCRRFGLSWKLRNGARNILKRHFCYLNYISNCVGWLFEPILNFTTEPFKFLT